MKLKAQSVLLPCTLLVASLSVPFTVDAQDTHPSPPPVPQQPPQSAPPPHHRDHPQPPPPPRGPQGEHARPLVKALESMPPEARQKLRENFDKWKNLPPETQEEIKAHAENLRRMAADMAQEEIQTFLKEIPEAHKPHFTKRFREERQKLSANIRTEMEARRKSGIAEITDRLKKEAAETPLPPSDTPAPAAPQSPSSPTPSQPSTPTP